MFATTVETTLRTNRPAIVAALRDVRAILRTTDEDSIDVRLVVYADGSWSVEHGDVGYDQIHGAACGASIIEDDSILADVADDLIDDAIESAFAAE